MKVKVERWESAHMQIIFFSGLFLNLLSAEKSVFGCDTKCEGDGKWLYIEPARGGNDGWEVNCYFLGF